MRVAIVGAGLAGCEAAWQLAHHGVAVDLYEMKPLRYSPAHRSPHLAELVCSNSFRSQDLANAAGLLKEELRRMNSLILRCADRHRLPAGGALGVDREAFAAAVTEAIRSHPHIRLIHQEVEEAPAGDAVVIATGPLTSEALIRWIQRKTGQDALHFYDAVAPIVDATTVDERYAFRASRYGKGGDDYLNCPLTESEYRMFWQALCAAERYPLHDFEDLEALRFFEGCLPIEEMARRGYETLLYGPCKPVGLVDPRTGKEPYAVVQLRQDNVAATLYNLVGFQTTLRRKEQERVFRLIPALRHAEFVRYGMVHRNTYLCAPRLLNPGLQFHHDPRVFFAGQITGVEGYIESTASGLMVALAVLHYLRGLPWSPPPRTTAVGALIYYLTHADPDRFQPMNINWGILDPVPRVPGGKRARRLHMAQRALADLAHWRKRVEENLATHRIRLVST